jgi:dTDP-4-amino-4,6-dideoxygalactose transaminase
LAAIAARHDLSLMFDAAHAMGCSHEGRPIGRFGRAEIISLHATKIINAFEGGVISTDDDELAERIRALRNFGFAGADHPGGPGINAKMSEASAAMALTSLEQLDALIDLNARNYARYADTLRPIPGIVMAPASALRSTNYHYVVVEIDAAQFGVQRDDLQRVLAAEGILARRYFYPGCRRIEPYRSRQRASHRPFPATDRLVERIMQLPTGTALTEADIDRICTVIRIVAENVDDVRRRLAAGGAGVPVEVGH